MILVAGATGNIGRALVARLVAAGQPTRALVRAADTQGGKSTGLPAEVEQVTGDLQDPASLDAALKGIERAFIVSSPDPNAPTLQGNFIDAAERANVQLLVKSSVYGAPEPTDAQFIRWHREIEDHLFASGLRYTLLRPNLFYQTLGQSATQIQATGVLAQPQGDGRVSAVDVRDIAAVAFCALTEEVGKHAGQAYELTGPEALSSEDMAQQLSAATGTTIRYQDITADQFKQGMTQAGLPPFMVDGLAGLYTYYKENRAARVSNAVQEVTGQTARTFAAWAQENAALFRKVG